jgi:hypothetical protein
MYYEPFTFLRAFLVQLPNLLAVWVDGHPMYGVPLRDSRGLTRCQSAVSRLQPLSAIACGIIVLILNVLIFIKGWRESLTSVLFSIPNEIIRHESRTFR